MKNTTIAILGAAVILAPALNAATILANELGYGISAAESNSFGGDFTADAYWGAGSQRSANGFQNNHRSGRLFAEFVITQAMIDEANLPGATVSLGYMVDSIGAGVAGTPYSDGLDLRYYGITTSNGDVGFFWGTAAVGADQSDILATTGSTGSQSITLTNTDILNGLKSATAGQRIAFGFVNSAGTGGGAVGTSTAETYAFGMNHTTTNYTLSVVPEPSAALLCGFGALALLRRRR